MDQALPSSSIGRRLAVRVESITLIHFAFLALSVLVTYYGLWNAYFTNDDFWMLGWVRHLPRLSDAIWAEFGYGVRPILDANMWLRVRLFDLDAAPYYWVSLFQHIFVTLIVYGLVRYWTRRRWLAFFSALFFATTFSHYTVITWITGSEYSLAAIFYLATLALFGIYLERRSMGWYLGALAAFVASLLLLELSLSLPLVLVAYHLTLGWGEAPVRLKDWRLLRPHVPFWAIFGLYLALQFSFLLSGSSEAAVGEVAYRPGLHMLGNLFYLVYLALPNVHYAVLESFFGRGFLPIFEGVSIALAVAGNALAAYGLLKGSRLVRFSIAFIYLTFLPYTLWEGRFAGAIRYMYLPSIGFSILVALFLLRLRERLSGWSQGVARVAFAAMTLGILVVNLLVVQVWVQRHVANSQLRRTFVMDFAQRYSNVPDAVKIYVEVPADKYVDLGSVCVFLLESQPDCQAFVSGERELSEAHLAASESPALWLRATETGIAQVYP